MSVRRVTSAKRVVGQRAIVAAVAMGLAATGTVATATQAQAVNPTVHPVVKRPDLHVGSPSKATPSKRPTLQLGSTGEAVSDLQRRLPMPNVTGYFGTMTDAYVRALQKKAKLKQNGIVGKKTWKKVGKIRVTVAAVPAAAPTVAAKPTPVAADSLRSRIMKIAASYQGVPYVATGYTPEQGFNCSSYTQWVYQQAGIDLGGAYTVTQYARAQKITKEQAKPGDLVFFYNYPNDFLGHMGIYAGNGKMWHAPRTGRVVSLDDVYSEKVLYARVL